MGTGTREMGEESGAENAESKISKEAPGVPAFSRSASCITLSSCLRLGLVACKCICIMWHLSIVCCPSLGGLCLEYLEASQNAVRYLLGYYESPSSNS